MVIADEVRNEQERCGGEALKKYYALEASGREADVYIFGDITSWEWLESDVSATRCQRTVRTGRGLINVHINSYGGEVARA